MMPFRSYLGLCCFPVAGWAIFVAVLKFSATQGAHRSEVKEGARRLLPANCWLTREKPAEAIGVFLPATPILVRPVIRHAQ